MNAVALTASAPVVLTAIAPVVVTAIALVVTASAPVVLPASTPVVVTAIALSQPQPNDESAFVLPRLVVCSPTTAARCSS